MGWSRTEDHSDVTDDFKQFFNLGKLWNAPAGWYTFRLNEPGYEQIVRMTDQEFAHWAENPQEMDRERLEAGLRQRHLRSRRDRPDHRLRHPLL